VKSELVYESSFDKGESFFKKIRNWAPEKKIFLPIRFIFPKQSYRPRNEYGNWKVFFLMSKKGFFLSK